MAKIYVLVRFEGFWGIARWLMLFMLIILSIALTIHGIRTGKKKAAIIMTIITVIAAPFLILTIKNTEPQIPIEPEKSKDERPVIPDVPSTPDTPESPETPTNPETPEAPESPTNNQASNGSQKRNSGKSNPKPNNTAPSNTITPEDRPNEEIPTVPEKQSFAIDVSNATIENPSDSYKEGDEITVSANGKTGYTFSNWISNVESLNGNATNPITFNISDNTSLTPAYAANHYFISYDANGGNGEMEKSEFIYDQPGQLNENQYTRKNQIFMSWNTNADGSGTTYADQADISNLLEEGETTIYAQWKKDISQATIAEASFELESGEQATINITNASELGEGYSFTSSQTSVATVDDNGTITAVAAGEATITITGATTGKTKQISVTVLSELATITYDTQYNGSTTAQIRVGGKLGNTIPAQSREHYIFDGWFDTTSGGNRATADTKVAGSTTYYANWRKSAYFLEVPASIEVERENSQSLALDLSQIEEEITVVSADTSIATVGANNQITGIAKGTTNIIIRGAESGEEKTIPVTVTPHTYTITFDFNDTTGETATRDAEENTTLTDIPSRERQGFGFQGWWTAAEDGTEFSYETPVTRSMTVYAHWSENIVCKVATELHQATCTNGACNTKDNIANGTTMVYGQIPRYNQQSVGDAYDCDINNDGEYDPQNERFYYLSENGNNAALVYHSGFEGSAGAANTNIFPNTSINDTLPTRTQWNNPGIAAIRIPSRVELEENCGRNGDLLVGCRFLFETSRYESTTTGRSAIWLTDMNGTYSRINTSTIQYEAPGKNNAVRPVIEVSQNSLEKAAPKPLHRVDFDAQGGNEVAYVEIEDGSVIGQLPTTQREGFELKGWSTTADGENLIDANYTVSADTTLYAKWEDLNKVAVYYVPSTNEPKYYDSLNSAISATPNNTRTVVHLLKDTNEKVTIGNSKVIDLNLQGHTLSNSSSNTILVNGTLEITGGTVANASTSGGIELSSTGNLTVAGGTIEATNSKQAIYNKGGQVLITGNPVISATTNSRAAVHNLENGTMIITGGTITSTRYYAVYNEKGTLVIGEKDGEIDISTPVISGKTFGVLTNSVNDSTFDFYDGIIRGESSQTGIATTTGYQPTVGPDAENSRIANIEDGSAPKTGTQDSFKTIYLEKSDTNITITFDANGGTASETSRQISPSSTLGTLPTAERAHYSFIGWFTEQDEGTQINENTAPTENAIYYAHWQPLSSDEIVTFYAPSLAAQNYLQNHLSWNQNGQDDYLTAMKNNYDENQCKNTAVLDVSSDFAYKYNTTGTVNCDQPNAYDTEITDGIIVKISDENTKTKTGATASYVNVTDGKITNMIPGTTYYWESTSDPNIYGYVKTTGEHRFIKLDATRNVRDLGGIATTDGKTIKYGYLIRGENIKGAQDITILKQLGITKEYDLRDSGNDAQMDNFARAETIHYNFNTDKPANLTKTRSALTQIMSDVAYNDEKIYFHCTHGADRTGTIAYLIEALLGIDEAARIEDYELTTLAGQSDRTQYYSKKATSSTTFDPNRKFVYMQSFARTNQEVLDWFMNSSSDPTADQALLEAFRNKVLE